MRNLETFILPAYEFLSSFIPFSVSLVIFIYRHRKKGLCVSKLYYPAMILFALYIIAVYHFTGAGTLYNGLQYQFEIRRDHQNFIPFSNDVDIIAYILNIILFIPLGFFIPLIWDRKNNFFSVLGTGFAFSLLIEASQLLNSRRTDIDDLLLNTSGALIGFAIYEIVLKAVKNRLKLQNIPYVELPVLIAITFAGRFLLFNELGAVKLLYGF